MKILVTSIVDLKNSLHNRPHHFIKHLARTHDVTVLCINDHWKAAQFDAESYGKDFEQVLQKVSLRYLTRRKISPILQEVSSVLTMGGFLKELERERFDVHLNYNTLFSGYLISRKLNALGIRSVYDIADDLPQMARLSPQIPSPFRPLAGFVAARMVGRNIGVSQKVTLTTVALKESCRVPADKAEVIPNGVDTGLFTSLPTEFLRKKLGLEGAFVIGYAGALREWVDLEPVFLCLKQLQANCPDTRLLVVGQEGRFAENKDLAARHGVSDKVVFTGTVPYNEVPAHMCCMDVCLIPFKTNSITENALPLKLFEYMGCGKPIISTKLYAIREAIGDRVMYASTPQELQDSVSVLYHDESLRSMLGAQGREFVSDSYSWSQCSSRLEALLGEVAASK